MKLKINGKEVECASPNLADLITELGLQQGAIAVAVDRRMVRRDEWPTVTLCEGQDILIIKAVCGG